MMDQQEQEEVLAALKEELQEYFTWIMEEFDYYSDQDEKGSAVSLDKPVQDKISKRVESDRMHLWERDLYAFHDHPQHPSIYSLFDAPDLEIIHYFEDIYCDHYKLIDLTNEEVDSIPEGFKRYEENFGVLLASQSKGWMYRLDLCEVCGLVEVWSMAYSPAEITLYSDEE